MSQALCSLSLAQDSNTSDRSGYEVYPSNPPNDGILFVDHSINQRSGHLGHALVEYEDGKILAFYPSCSTDAKGHSAVGWMEYKRSVDGGRSWSAPQVLDYTKDLYDAGQSGKPGTRKYAAFAEKAVVTEKGEIVLFFLICDITEDPTWSHFQIPTYIISKDGGHTWSEPFELCSQRSRVYDAKYHNGEILVLNFINENDVSFLGNKEEDVYELYVSKDGGRTFRKRSELPFDTMGKSYGTMGILESGGIVTYIYNANDEFNSDYVVSMDGGYSWSEAKTAYFSKKMRNQQMSSLNGLYFMHGRSGSKASKKGEQKGHMVLYSSKDGFNWDDGIFLRMREAGLGAYSNSIPIGTLNSDKKDRLLIQASHAYEQNKTNVLHWWVDTK